MAEKRIPVPSAPGRIARTEEQRQNFEQELKAKERAIKRRLEIWEMLSRVIHNSGGWLTSAPGTPVLRLETRVGSDLPDRLYDAGFDLRPGGTSEKICGGKILPANVFTFRISPVK
jgi:hypothetical protein